MTEELKPEQPRKLPRAIEALLQVKEHIENTKEEAGRIPCQCGGELHFSVAKINNHVRANCPKCGLSFME